MNGKTPVQTPAIAQGVLSQMSRMGAPNIAKQTTTMTPGDESLNLMNLGLLLMMLLGEDIGGLFGKMPTTPIPGARPMGGVPQQVPSTFQQTPFRPASSGGQNMGGMDPMQLINWILGQRR